MEASRKYVDDAFDNIPSDRLTEAYNVEALREQHARIVALLAQVRLVMIEAGHGWLHTQLANALGNFFEYAVDPSYRSRPKTLPDINAERERLILYGSDKQHNEDIRNGVRFDGDPSYAADPGTGLFPWEGK